MGKNKKENSIRIVRNNQNEFTFDNANYSAFLLEMKEHDNETNKPNEKDVLKRKKITNKELKAKGLKFSVPSTRNHSAIYE